MFDINLSGTWIVTRDTALGGSKDTRFSSPEELKRTWQITMDSEELKETLAVVASTEIKFTSRKFVASQLVAWRDPSHSPPGPGQNASPIVGLIIPHPRATAPNRRRPMLVMLQTTPDLYTISWVGSVTGLSPVSATESAQQIVAVEGIYVDADGVQSNFKMERSG